MPPEQANHQAAYDWAKEAVRRDPDAPAWQQLAGLACWKLDPASSIAHMDQAVRSNPQDLRLRLQYADMLLRSSQRDAAQRALRQLDAAEAVDRGLLPDSTERLNSAEREQVRQLRQHATISK